MPTRHLNLDELIRVRRDLHAHPELRFDERRTASVLAGRLEAVGFRLRRLAGTGIVATIGQGEPHVGLRADMDALPIQDLKDVAYASTNPGVCHACGHDVHMTVMLGVAEALAESGIEGALSVVLQPAEEIPFGESSGAAAMIADGALDPPFDALIGLHCWPGLRVGQVGVDRAIAMAAKDAFQVVLNGTDGHAAMPSASRDAIVAIAQTVVAIHLGIARRVGAGDLAIVNVGTISGGRSQSIVAGRAEITGTLRTVDPSLRISLREVIERVVAATADGAGVDHDLRWANAMPAVRNDPALVELADRCFGDLPTTEVVRLSEPPMTTDDFALYAERVPAIYLKLGVARDHETAPALHNGRFDVDEAAIGVGADAVGALVRAIWSAQSSHRRREVGLETQVCGDHAATV